MSAPLLCTDCDAPVTATARCENCGSTDHVVCGICEDGLVEMSESDGSNPYYVRCACAIGDALAEPNPREAGDDDGVEYSDPREVRL